MAEERAVTEETGGPMDTGDIDVAAAVAEMRQRIDGLGDSITELRGEADRLRTSASARMVVAVLDPPAPDAAGSTMDELVALSDSVEALGRHAGEAQEADAAGRGRHAANEPGEFDPRPFDPETDDTDEPIVVGRHGDTRPRGAFDSLAAAPAFEPEVTDPESLPAFEVKERPDTFAAPDPSDVLSPEQPPTLAPDHPSFGDGDDGPGATVLEFTPRSLTDPGAEPAFGAVAPEPVEPPEVAEPAPASEPTPAAVDDAPAFGALPEPPAQAPAADGLDAIASSESTEVPSDWDDAGSDDAAFDKFFSSDVEPEPAQRWLLNE